MLVLLIVGLILLLALIKEPVVSFDFGESRGSEISAKIVIFPKEGLVEADENIEIISIEVDLRISASSHKTIQASASIWDEILVHGHDLRGL